MGALENEENVYSPQRPESQDATKRPGNNYRPQQQNNYRKRIFEEYWNDARVNEAVRNGSVIKGTLRINPRNYQECFVDNPKGSEYDDIFIQGFARNRAMHGDRVAVKIKPREEWLVKNEYWKKEVPNDELEKALQELTVGGKEKKNERYTLLQYCQAAGLKDGSEVPDESLVVTGAIIQIIERLHLRLASGSLNLPHGPNSFYAMFIPKDSRTPRMMIQKKDVDEEFFRRPQDFANFIYIAELSDWKIDSVYAEGRLVKNIGERGNVDAETTAIMIENGIDFSEFTEEALACLNVQEEWQIPAEEFDKRRDLRDEIIFTIDPKTARDLDDALSIKMIDDSDGNGAGWEIGVHIADVTYFIEDGCVLDQMAQKRANSTYLAQMVIPMLPRILSERLCSLNPGVDRLCFSVIWKLNDKAEIVDTWFGRTIIRSKVKLAYEHAQDFIENPEKQFSEADLPEICDNVSVEQIREKVFYLHNFSKILRALRFAGGALRIDQTKLKFAWDPETKQPIGVSVYEIKDSNRLVEEFMLLANMSVAKKIEQNFKETAFLRMHSAPNAKTLKEAMEKCAKMGFPIDGRSSKEISSTLRRYSMNSHLEKAIVLVISNLTVKSMKRATYICTGALPDDNYRHYALNVPFYTHFTSPIRRYSDMVVHRQLAAVLRIGDHPNKGVGELQNIAKNCNSKKEASKEASQQSDELFLALFVFNSGSIFSAAVVLNVLDESFDVIVLQYGIIKRVYTEGMAISKYLFDKKGNSITLFWKKDSNAEKGNRDSFTQTIQLCTVVYVELYAKDATHCMARMLRPNLSQRVATRNTLPKMLETNEELVMV